MEQDTEMAEGGGRGVGGGGEGEAVADLQFLQQETQIKRTY